MRNVLVNAHGVQTKGVIIDGELYISPLPLNSDIGEEKRLLIAAKIAAIPTAQQEGENAGLNIELSNRKRLVESKLSEKELELKNTDFILNSSKKQSKVEGLTATEKAQVDVNINSLKKQKEVLKKDIENLQSEIENLTMQLELTAAANTVIDLSDL